MTGIATFADHYAESDYASFDSRILAPGRLGIDLIHVAQDTICAPDPAMPQLAIATCLHVDERFRGRCHLGDGWIDFSDMRVGDIAVGPANCQTDYDLSGRHDFLIMAIPLPVLTEAFQINEQVIEDAQMCLLHGRVKREQLGNHETAHRLLCSVRAEAERQSTTAGLLLDSTAITITALLLGHHFPIRQSDIPKLDDARLARAIDYIEAELAMPLRLEDIAAVACISTYHFSRSFKAATGLTVHNYVLLRRLTRAKELLATTKGSIAQIAFDVGFASQAHMTDVFRSRVGITPMRYREQGAGRAY